MRIALAQINPTLADFSGNAQKIIEFAHKAAERKADLVVFPECALYGYHPFDMLERKDLVAQQLAALKAIQKKLPPKLHVLFGLITENTVKKGRPYFNSAVLLVKGQKPKYFHKTLLPTGDIFDEARFIEPGDIRKNLFRIGSKKFYLTICEDIWAWPDKDGISPYDVNPLASVREKVDMVVNLSASPFFLGKLKLRKYVAGQTAKHFKAPVMYVNLVGAQDEVIYDGGSFVIDPKGKTVFHSHFFQEDMNVFDLDTKESWYDAPVPADVELLRQAIVLGIRDFCEKTGLSKIHLGLSGGIDSAVVAALAVDALGPSKVVGFGLPGPFSSPESLKLAEALAKNLNIDIKTIDVGATYEHVTKTLKDNLGYEGFSVANENLQARLRGLYLMAYSNIENSLLLSTSNKSETATGYATLYGDMCGGLSPIADLTKHQVYRLADYYNNSREIIPLGIVKRPPSAELRPHQKDSDSLPEYDDLDASVEKIVERAGKATTETDKWLLKRLSASEFKRWQATPILKVTSHSFGRGRRWPIAHKAYKDLKKT